MGRGLRCTRLERVHEVGQIDHPLSTLLLRERPLEELLRGVARAAVEGALLEVEARRVQAADTVGRGSKGGVQLSVHLVQPVGFSLTLLAVRHWLPSVSRAGAKAHSARCSRRFRRGKRSPARLPRRALAVARPPVCLRGQAGVSRRRVRRTCLLPADCAAFGYGGDDQVLLSQVRSRVYHLFQRVIT